MKKVLLGLCLSLSLAAGACGEEESLPEVDCTTPAVPTFSMVSALATCTNCHSSALSGTSRNGAPAGINYDTFAAAMAAAEDGVAAVHEGEMPPASSGFTLTAQEKTDFYRWGLCGTPQ